MNYELISLPIKDLYLWDENARFPDKYYNSDQKDLILFFLSKPDFKIKLLVEEIVKDIDLPQLEKLIVFWSDEGRHVALEGNRRLTAYKLLINPEIVTDQKLNKYLVDQQKICGIDNSFRLDCIVTDKDTGFRYIDRKHSNNNNEVGWQEPERAAYKIRRGSKSQSEFIKSGIVKIVRELDLPEEMKDRILGKGFVSTFFRVVAGGAARLEFGFGLDDDNNLIVKDPNFKDKLKVIIHNTLQKKDFNDNVFDSRTLNEAEKVKSYVKSVNPADAKKVETDIKANTTEDLFGGKTLNITPTNKQNKAAEKPSLIRSKPLPTGLFASTDIPFRIASPSLRLMYDELRTIDVAQFPNATHDLLRSFLECSLIVFLKNNKEYDIIQKNAKHNPTLGEMLTHVINGKCKAITDKNLIDTINQVKTDYDQAYSLERLHMINHNENWVSTEREVRTAWAKLEGLFRIALGSN